MLKVCFQAITTGQKIWSRFPAPRQTIREMSGQLGMNAAKIVEVESDGSVFAPYLIGKEVPPEKGYKEVDFFGAAHGVPDQKRTAGLSGGTGDGTS